MEENNYTGSGKARAFLSQLILLLLMGSSILLLPYLETNNTEPSTFYYVFASILACGSVLYSYFFEPQMSEGILFFLVPVLYLISVGVLMVTDQPMNLPFWSFGGIFLLSIYGLRTGMFWNFFLFFLAGSVQVTVSEESIWIQMLSMLLTGFFLPRKGKWQQYVRFLLVYGIAVILSRLFFYFCFRDDIKNGNVFFIYLVYVILIMGCYIFAVLMRETAPAPEFSDIFTIIEQENEKELRESEAAAALENTLANGLFAEDAEQTAKTAQAETEKRPEERKTEEARLLAEKKAEEARIAEEKRKAEEARIAEEKKKAEEARAARARRIRELCSEEAPLLVSFRDKLPENYRHCLRVAECAAEAAKRLPDMDAYLTYAGCLYHEIGRLAGKNTAENALMIAKKEGFPEELLKILACCGGKWDKPYSKETAVMMLSDNICSMVEYLKKTQTGKVLFSRVIDKTITLRVNNGELNESGLTVADLSALRNIMADILKEEMF